MSNEQKQTNLHHHLIVFLFQESAPVTGDGEAANSKPKVTISLDSVQEGSNDAQPTTSSSSQDNGKCGMAYLRFVFLSCIPVEWV